MAAKQLYQLESKTRLAPGAYVAVNGPWDKWGYVIKSELRASGRFLNLIRGCDPRPGQTPVAQF